MHPDTAEILRGYGSEPGDFRARRLQGSDLEGIDLTLTMTGAHRDEVLGRSPRALARTFTLREASALLEGVPRDAGQTDARVADRGRALGGALAGERSRRRAGGDDVPDAIGRPLELHEEVGELIVSTLLPLLSRLVQLRPPARACTRQERDDSPVGVASAGQSAGAQHTGH